MTDAYPEITKVSFNHDFWLAPRIDKVLLGGSTLPASTHLTFHFGPKTGIFDLHLTKELPEARKIYLTLFTMNYDDAFAATSDFNHQLIPRLPLLLEPRFAEVKTRVIPMDLPDDDRTTALRRVWKRLIGDHVTKKKKTQFRLEFTEDDQRQLQERLAENGLELMDEWLQWMKQNALTPSEYEKSGSSIGLLLSEVGRGQVLAVPSEQGVEHRVMLNDEFSQTAGQVLDDMFPGERIRLQEHWTKGLSVIERATSQADVAGFKSRRLRYTAQQHSPNRQSKSE